MNQRFTRQELFEACYVLFGREIDVSVGFLNYLQISGIKSAYRKKALETHPDRAAAVVGKSCEMDESFKVLNSAYKLLSSYVKNPSLPDYKDHKTASVFHRHTRSGLAKTGRYYFGEIPRMRMPLGRFLYYNGVIPYECMLDSVVWQRMQHPLIGKVAVKNGLLSDRDVLKIILSRFPNEKFGECARRLRFITKLQLDMVLLQQTYLRPLIGNYFTAQGILTPRELSESLILQYTHNRKYQR